MEQTFYRFGILMLRWEKDGCTYEAVKEQVDFFGKECFEQDLEEMIEEYGIPEPDGCTWAPSDEEIQDSHITWYEWLRDQEIM